MSRYLRELGWLREGPHLGQHNDGRLGSEVTINIQWRTMAGVKKIGAHQCRVQIKFDYGLDWRMRSSA